MERKDRSEVEKLCECLGIRIPASIARSSDNRLKLNCIMSKWLPLADAILEMVVTQLPAANEVSVDRATKLMCSATQRFESLPEKTQELRKAFVECKSSKEDPLIVYISKMFGVSASSIPPDQEERKEVGHGVGGLLSEEEIAVRREKIRQHKESSIGSVGTPLSEAQLQQSEAVQLIEETTFDEVEEEEEVLIAFARVFSGLLRVGQKVFVLGPKHKPSDALLYVDEGGGLPDDALKNMEFISQCEVQSIYLLLGRRLKSIQSAPCGSIVGLGGLSDYIIKSATLSSTPLCPPFTELTLQATPILRVAVEPVNPKDLQKLRTGLKRLNQADPCAQVIFQGSGEYILVTAGEVHLERCIADLQERYAKVPISVSAPIIPFRETIIPPPTVDRLNEAIFTQNVLTKKGDGSEHPGLGVAEYLGSIGKLRIRAVPLPLAVTAILEANSSLLKAMAAVSKKEAVSESCEEMAGSTEMLSKEVMKGIMIVQHKISKVFEEAGKEWENAVNEIWSLGPNYYGPNMLLNRIKHYPRPSVWDNCNLKRTSKVTRKSLNDTLEKIDDENKENENRTVGELISAKKDNLENADMNIYDTNVIAGFQLAVSSGPLCEEPMHGLCFIIEDWSISKDSFSSIGLSGQIISLVKDTLRKAFENSHQRLMVAMYSCIISVTSEVVGKMYSAIGKRLGRIIDGDITEGSTSWNIAAYIPVVESLNLSNELRKSTSGEAMPQLLFSHWETLDIDPFWEPHTTEELAHWGEKSDCDNIARKYMNSIRKRKGLGTDDKIVEYAEKQRTLNKKK